MLEHLYHTNCELYIISTLTDCLLTDWPADIDKQGMPRGQSLGLGW